jgi:HAMP domain-containing protein
MRASGAFVLAGALVALILLLLLQCTVASPLSSLTATQPQSQTKRVQQDVRLKGERMTTYQKLQGTIV